MAGCVQQATATVLPVSHPVRGDHQPPGERLILLREPCVAAVVARTFASKAKDQSGERIVFGERDCGWGERERRVAGVVVEEGVRPAFWVLLLAEQRCCAVHMPYAVHVVQYVLGTISVNPKVP